MDCCGERQFGREDLCKTREKVMQMSTKSRSILNKSKPSTSPKASEFSGYKKVDLVKSKCKFPKTKRNTFTTTMNKEKSITQVLAKEYEGAKASIRRKEKRHISKKSYEQFLRRREDRQLQTLCKRLNDQGSFMLYACD
ncbi:unnamed protein product [Moneuplotes crassus]|uniref:Uncharacterized protein n=1 Tax=Euplotes crassus TaxID=5936 RepID=A0AAD1XHB1_EUPCR|nr:unnamed protein product [Moneuplotes crassus]